MAPTIVDGIAQHLKQHDTLRAGVKLSRGLMGSFMTCNLGIHVPLGIQKEKA